MSQIKSIKPNHTGTKVIFNNPVLERLSRTHVAVPITIFVGIAIGLLYIAITRSNFKIYTIITVFIAGWLVFSLVEYLMHRYVFHMNTNTKIKEKIQYNFHGVHHEYPKDKDRLAMPPLVSLTIATILFFLFQLIMGDYTYAFLPGFIVGYAAYLFVHFIVHAWQPPSNIFKALWVNHGIHHYKDHERAFGVSTPLWDYIFRTMPKR